MAAKKGVKRKVKGSRGSNKSSRKSPSKRGLVSRKAAPRKKRMTKITPQKKVRGKAKQTSSKAKKVRVKAKNVSGGKKTAVKNQAVKEVAAPAKVEDAYAQEVIAFSGDLFEPGRPQTLTHWFRMYCPVVITMGVGLATYFYLIFYLFYPAALLNGHWFQLLLLLVFIFFLAGLFIYLGMRSELLFIRILSFIFVFIIFTFLLLFVLLAHTLT